MAAPIQHVVVLMFENRSFDSVLGFLRDKDASFEGLDGSEDNPLGDGTSETVRLLSGNEGMVTEPDPPHEHDDAIFHLFRSDSAEGEPDNQGFVERYRMTAAGAPLSRDLAKQVMGCFDANSQLPALSALAANFVVCDHWFSSFPGPTWPNRFFAHCATSAGHVESPSETASVWDEIGHSTFGMPTIQENLAAAGLSWNVFYHDVPQALALARLHDHRDRFRHFSAFLDAAKAGTLPSYSFIEPGFFDSKILGLHANDMHPPHDVRLGDKLAADVYNAIRANEELFRKTLLLIVWDEHGGFFDHVPPPTAVTPDAASAARNDFKFDRLGVRVPAIVVSPWVEKGVVDRAVYDHTSIPATLKKLFGLTNFLSKRDAAANTFDAMLVRSAPRDDTPEKILQDTEGMRVALAALAEAPAAGVMSGHQNDLLAIARQLEVTGHPSPPEGSPEAAILHVARYLDG